MRPAAHPRDDAPSSAGVGETQADIAIQTELFDRLKREVSELQALHSGQSVEQIGANSDRDRWFTPADALAGGSRRLRPRRPRRGERGIAVRPVTPGRPSGRLLDDDSGTESLRDGWAVGIVRCAGRPGAGGGMSLPEPGTGLSWVGKTVVDREGAEIGRCTAVLTDDGTGLPEWLYASLDERTAIIPLVDATEQDDRVRVTVGRTDVENAPPPAGDTQHLSQDEEAALYRHYGIEYSRDASETVLPADIESPDAGAGTPESAAPPSAGRVRALVSAAGGLAGVGLLVAVVLGLRRRRSRPAPSGAADAAVRSVRAVSVAVARWAATVGAASAPVLSTAGRVVWRGTSAGATSALRTGGETARLAAAVLPRAAAGALRLAQSGLGAAWERGGAVETVPDVVSETGERLQKGWRKSMGRFSLGLGFGVGYVLGARAGRARFEQIRQAAASFTERPEVQQALEKVKGAAPGPLQSALGGLSRRGSGTTAGTVGLPPEVDVDSAVTTSTGSAAPPEPRGATDLPAGGPETP